MAPFGRVEDSKRSHKEFWKRYDCTLEMSLYYSNIMIMLIVYPVAKIIII